MESEISCLTVKGVNNSPGVDVCMYVRTINIRDTAHLNAQWYKK